MKRYIKSAVTPVEKETYTGLDAIASNSDDVSVLRQVYQRLGDDNDLPRRAPALISLAGNPNTPVDILEDLAKHGSIAMQEAVFLNPSSPGYLLELISQQEAARRIDMIGAHILIRTELTGDFLSKLANNPNIYLSDRALFRLARHLNTPENVAVQLAENNPRWTMELDVKFIEPSGRQESVELSIQVEAYNIVANAGFNIKSCAIYDYNEDDERDDGVAQLSVEFRWYPKCDDPSVIGELENSIRLLFDKYHCSVSDIWFEHFLN